MRLPPAQPEKSSVWYWRKPIGGFTCSTRTGDEPSAVAAFARLVPYPRGANRSRGPEHDHRVGILYRAFYLAVIFRAAADLPVPPHGMAMRFECCRNGRCPRRILMVIAQENTGHGTPAPNAALKRSRWQAAA